MRRLPASLRGYDRAWLPADVMAGVTIWALMVPQAIAYAGIAGVPVQNGLYVMPLAVVGYVLLGSSRHLFVGPSAGVATLSASVVALVATASTGSATGNRRRRAVQTKLLIGFFEVVNGDRNTGVCLRSDSGVNQAFTGIRFFVLKCLCRQTDHEVGSVTAPLKVTGIAATVSRCVRYNTLP
jgi:MFS superfamily sulfate permease-like transporter